MEGKEHVMKVDLQAELIAEVIKAQPLLSPDGVKSIAEAISNVLTQNFENAVFIYFDSKEGKREK